MKFSKQHKDGSTVYVASGGVYKFYDSDDPERAVDVDPESLDYRQASNYANSHGYSVPEWAERAYVAWLQRTDPITGWASE